MKYVDTSSQHGQSSLAGWFSSVASDGIAELYLQTGYFSAGSLDFLAHAFSLKSLQSCKLGMLVGSNDPRTLVADAKKLIQVVGAPRKDADLAIACFAGGLFHPKTYVIRRKDSTYTAYVGSSNLTPSGLARNVEAGIILDSKEGDPESLILEIVQTIQDWLIKTPIDGIYKLVDDSSVDVLAANGILAVSAPPKPTTSVSSIGVAKGLRTLKPLLTWPALPIATTKNSAATVTSIAPSTSTASATSTTPSTNAVPPTSTVPSTSTTPSTNTAPSTSAMPSTSTTPSINAVPTTSTVPSTSATASTSTVLPSFAGSTVLVAEITKGRKGRNRQIDLKKNIADTYFGGVGSSLYCSLLAKNGKILSSEARTIGTKSSSNFYVELSGLVGVVNGDYQDRPLLLMEKNSNRKDDYRYFWLYPHDPEFDLVYKTFIQPQVPARIKNESIKVAIPYSSLHTVWPANPIILAHP